MTTSARPRLRIDHLSEAPGAAAVLARWFGEEWGPITVYPLPLN